MDRIAPPATADPVPPSLQRARLNARRFKQRLIVLVSAALLLILGLAATVAFNASGYRQYSRWTRRSYQVERQILRVDNALRHTEVSLRNYLLTGDPAQLESYFEHMPQIDASSAELVRLTLDNDSQNQRARQLRHSLMKRRQHLQTRIAARRASWA